MRAATSLPHGSASPGSTSGLLPISSPIRRSTTSMPTTPVMAVSRRGSSVIWRPHDDRRRNGLDGLYAPRPLVRRALRDRRADHRHLLPPLVRGTPTAARERALLRRRRGSAGRGAARVQALS